MFPTYSRMKDSGVKWLGRVPDNWRVKRLKDVVLVNAEALPETTDPEMVIQYVDIGNVQEGEDAGTPQEVTFFNAPSRARRIVRTGDTIISTVRTYLKAVAHFEDPPDNLIASTGFAVLSPGRDLAKRFLLYLVRSEEFIQRVVAHSVGVSYPAINQSELAGLPAWIPSFSEQESIASFLDRKTALIDELIAKRERQIELLQEQRTALISRAVVKGLNLDVPMKDSGVEWLGRMPDHWSVTTIKRVASIYGRIGFRGYATADLVDERDGALTLGGVNLTPGGCLNLSKKTFLSWEKYEESPEIKVTRGDLLIGQRGTGTCGRVAHVNFDIGPTTINPSLVLLKRSKINNRFLWYWLLGKPVQSFFGSLLNSTAVPMLSQEQIGNVWVCRPPVREQLDIASFLDRETNKIDTFVTKVQQSIEKLREYRQSLTSVAVTGKIDVRNWQSSSEPAEETLNA